MNEDVWAILPVKTLGWAKRRLKKWLSLPERRGLVLELLATSLCALREALPVQHIVIVTHDAGLLELADRQGLIALRQSGYGLNAAIRQGELLAVEGGALGVLVILPDLPLIVAADVHELLNSNSTERQVTIAAGQRGGTHALLVRPPGWLTYSFGNESYQRHVSGAQYGGARVISLRNEHLAFDVDTLGDLRRARQARPDLFRLAPEGLR